MKICVYGASSPTIDKDYIVKTEALGQQMVKRGHSLVFGGGTNGLMGAVARGVKSQNGHILGVIPKFFRHDRVEVIYTECDELVEPDTMRERKQIMEDNADAFIITPGGIGTFEEFYEILTLKQLCRHNKPIAIYNINNYYDETLQVILKAIEKNFVTEKCNELFKVCSTLDEIFTYIESNQPQLALKELKEG
ncbi:MAG: TIGR00730 family Rossman fold protein [Clostridia bacterium]|nr:TIGR00730 family Rossman fold protein [Clostridia bacterium]